MWPWDADPSTTPTPDPSAVDPGFLTKAASNPYYSVPFALLSGLGAAAGHAPARGIQGINAGLQLGLEGERAAYGRAKEKRLSDVLSKMATSTTPVTTDTGLPSSVYAPDTGPGSERMSSAQLGDILGSVPTAKITEQKPNFTSQQQAYLNALAETHPNAALAAMGSQIFKEPRPPVHVPEGAAVQQSDGSWTVPNPRAPREVTPPRPSYTTQGGMAVDSVYNPDTKRYETTKTPVTAAPARAQTPEQTAKTVADTAAALARAETSKAQAIRINLVAQALKDPTLNKEKLTTMRAGLLREKDMIEKGTEDPHSPENEQRLTDINLLLDYSRQRLADAIRGEKKDGGAEMPAAPKAPTKIKSDAEYADLPSGTVFIDPKGQRRRKP